MNEIILQLYTQYQLLQYLQIVGWVGFPLALATFLISYAVYSSVLCDSVSESIAGKIMVWLPTLMVIASVVLLFVTGYKQMVVLKPAIAKLLLEVTDTYVLPELKDAWDILKSLLQKACN